jgi:hypothetical protein
MIMSPEEQRLELGTPRDPDLGEHVFTYRSFVRVITYAAFAFPLFFAFVIYWTV